MNPRDENTTLFTPFWPLCLMAMSAGATSVVVTVTPTYDADTTSEQATLALAAGSYLMGSPSNATVVIRRSYVLATGGTMTNYTDAGGTNWIAHIFTTSAQTLSILTGGRAEVLLVAGGGGGCGSDNSGGAAWSGRRLVMRWKQAGPGAGCSAAANDQLIRVTRNGEVLPCSYQI